MALITNIEPIDPTTFEFQEYNNSDVSLIDEKSVETSFIQNKDYIEYHVYDLSNQLIFSEVGFNSFRNFRLLDNNLVLDPLQDIQNLALDGTYNAVYNFLNPLLGSNSNTRYYISEISSDRTEIRLDTTQISLTETNQGRTVEGPGAAIGGAINDIKDFDFYLNFGENQLALAVNIQLDESDPANPTILIKLYEPLPPQFDLKTELWVVEKIAESVAFQVENTETFDLADLNIPLAGPNINLPVKDQLNNSTEAKSLNDLQTSYTASVTNQLLNVVSQSGASINVDYTEYENFVFFSSAQTRLDNFKTKLGDLEQLEASASLVTSSFSSSILASEQVYRNQIKDIITNFDGYEYFLYFTSGSKAWPKSNTQVPFSNVTVASTEGTNFYATQSISASLYDGENDNQLKQAIPEYIREDSQNEGFDKFVDMVGQHFDSIKLYQDAVTEKYNTNPSLTAGLSKDLVGDAIKDFGLKLYQSSFTNQELYSYFLGVGTSGSIFPPTGSELITNYISASNDNIPVEDAIKGNYKKIYHALPSLLKRKGTLRGLRELINAFGVPDTVLRISEFGNKEKYNSSNWDLWQNKYNYAFSNSGSGGNIKTNWKINSVYGTYLNVPNTVQFRFKALPSSSFVSETTQSLWSLNNNAPDIARLELEYNPDFTSGSYSGSIIDPQNQYATLRFHINNGASTSITLPFIDNGWWSVMVVREENITNSNYTLYAGNKIYNGNDGSQIGFIESSSFSSGDANYRNSTTSFFPQTASADLNVGVIPFTGSYQEIRYYSEPLNINVFKDYVMNPHSIEGTTITGSYNQLVFRASLGGESYTGSTSIHPTISGSSITESFSSGDSNFTINNGNFVTNKEIFFLNQPLVGIQNRNSGKINNQNLTLPSGDTLSNTISIQQKPTQSFSPSVNSLEVAFSPQNEINDDIISQLGYFNIGDYIGDPRLVSSSAKTYPALEDLSTHYFNKYTSFTSGSSTQTYDVYDYIRLIKFFDNSLFKMIKDFVPARTSLSTGVVVKPHILERTKYPQPKTSFEELLYTGSVKSFPLGYQTGSLVLPIGGNGGSFNNLRSLKAFPGDLDLFLTRVTGLGASVENLTPLTNFLTLIGGSDELEFSNTFNQSFTYSVTTPSGSLIVTQSDAREFFNGEFSGSNFTVTNGELNIDCIPFKSSQVKGAEYIPTLFLASTSNTDDFLNEFNVPPSGFMYLLYDDEDGLADLPVGPSL